MNTRLAGVLFFLSLSPLGMAGPGATAIRELETVLPSLKEAAGSARASGQLYNHQQDKSSGLATIAKWAAISFAGVFVLKLLAGATKSTSPKPAPEAQADATRIQTPPPRLQEDHVSHVTVACPKCDQQLRAALASRQVTLRCPACKHTFTFG